MPTLNRPKKKKNYSKKNPIAANIYNSPTWRGLRKLKFMINPMCQNCLKKPTEEIHHIKPFLEGKDEEEQRLLAFDINNLQSLCSDCHHAIHNERNKVKKNKSNNK